MPGRRGVHHHQVELALERFRYREQREQLVDPGWRQIDEVVHHRPIERRVEAGAPAQLVEQLVDALPVLRPAGGERPIGVQLARQEPLRDLARLVGQRGVERVAERVRRIGRHEEHALTAPATPKRRRRGDR